MRILILIIFLLHFNTSSHSQVTIIKVENDRMEIAKAIEFIDTAQPRVIGLTFYFECAEGETDEILSESLINVRSLLMPSKLLPLNGELIEVIGCGYLYPLNVQTGYLNLLKSKDADDTLDYLPLSNIYQSQTSYHFAVMLAFSYDFKKTQNFLAAHDNVTRIEVDKSCDINEYHIEEFYNKRNDIGQLKDHVIIISGSEEDESDVGGKASTHVLAASVCQIIGDPPR